MTLTKDKPVTNRDKSRSATPGAREKKGAGKGKGKQIPACPEFFKTGKCTWAERPQRPKVSVATTSQQGTIEEGDRRAEKGVTNTRCSNN